MKSLKMKLCFTAAAAALLMGNAAQAQTAGRPVSGAIVPGSYIVKLQLPGPTAPAAAVVNAAAQQIVSAAGGKLTGTFSNLFTGFSAELPDRALAGLRNNPLVVSIEPDRVVTAAQVTTTQTNAPVALARVDQRPWANDASYTYSNTGAGITAYVVDSGIRRTHVEFGGRVAAEGFDNIGGGPFEDCNGHGTHVASFLGGATYGVAKGVNLVSVKVLACDVRGRLASQLSTVTRGLEWIAPRADPATSVLNLSLGLHVPERTILDDAVETLTNRGFAVVVAANNESMDACLWTPGKVPGAITVGATYTANDHRGSFSNYGTCVDLFAPGAKDVPKEPEDGTDHLPGASNTSDTGTVKFRGTSMAAPLVSGKIALMKAKVPSATLQEVTTALLNHSTSGAVIDAGPGSPNRMLYTTDNPAAVSTVTGFAGPSNSSTWLAIFRMGIKDADSGQAAPSGLRVSGTWSTGEAASCVTDASGNCSVAKWFYRSYTTASFRVTDVTGLVHAYAPERNVTNFGVVGAPSAP